MKQPLDGKVTVITGASSGVGTAIARRFAAAGARIVLSGRQTEKLQLLCDEILAAGSESLAVLADVTDYIQIRNLIDRTVEAFGRVDVMINCACRGLFNSLEETTPQEMDDQIDVDIRGVCYGSKAALEVMRDQESGNIINIGLMNPDRPGLPHPLNAAARHAVIGFSRALCEEVRAYGIRVDALCPAANDDGGSGRDVRQGTDDAAHRHETIADLAFGCVAGSGTQRATESSMIHPHTSGRRTDRKILAMLDSMKEFDRQ